MPGRFDPQGAANFSFPTSGSKVSAATGAEQHRAQLLPGHAAAGLGQCCAPSEYRSLVCGARGGGEHTRKAGRRLPACDAATYESTCDCAESRANRRVDCIPSSSGVCFEPLLNPTDAAFAWWQEDPLTLINEKEERTKSAWVKIMGAREARNDLRECYRCARSGRSECGSKRWARFQLRRSLRTNCFDPAKFRSRFAGARLALLRLTRSSVVADGRA
jgi:hypothetical protein